MSEPGTKPVRRWNRAARLALIGLAAALVGTGIPLAAPPHAQADDPDTRTIASDALSVDVSAAFPAVVTYRHLATGAAMAGQVGEVGDVIINDKPYRAEVELGDVTHASASYELTFPGLADVKIGAKLSVDAETVAFEVTNIDDPGKAVQRLQIPGLNLVTVSSTDDGAQVSAATLVTDRGASGDTFEPVTASTPVDTKPKGSAYVVANTAKLAAGIETNTVYDAFDSTHQAPLRESGRFFRQATKDGDVVRVGIAPGQWTYRAVGSSHTEELPWAKVAITADANGDKQVDWQDGIIAFRSIAVEPNRGNEVPDQVITHIPFNMSSHATHPFLRTLDDIKRISRATDGLGQTVMLKGFAGEGHDSAHPDYAGHYNLRAGGLKEMNLLAKQAKKWGAQLGVHISANGVEPEAHAMNNEIVGRNPSFGWTWVSRHYNIDERYDAHSGSLAKRLTDFVREVDDNMKFIYVDSYYNYEWLAHNLAREITSRDLRLASEWSYAMERQSTWSHWAADENYGGQSEKGLSSQIIRMARNHLKDAWNPHPLLGIAQTVEAEGWTGHNNWNDFYSNIWKHNVTAKFLQHFQITKWDKERIDFTGGVSVAGKSAADRVITMDGAEVARGNSYLLPWQPTDPTKLYHYNPAGGTSTWTLPKAFASATSLTAWQLTEQGRTNPIDVPITDGTVTLTAKANTPYVLSASGSSLPEDTQLGEGTPVVDPGFNAGNLDAWDTAHASISKTATGQNVAVLGEGAAHLSQQLAPLAAGTYSLSALVEIEPGKSRPVTLSAEVAGKKPATVSFDHSPAKNWVGSDEHHSTHFQRVRVLLDVAEGERATLRIAAGDGAAKVRVDDVRVVKTTRVPTSGVMSEDFEDVDQGWGPFVKGNSSGLWDARTHLAERNEPYTQRGWHTMKVDDVLGGKRSLKTLADAQGLVYRSLPTSIPFTPGHEYRVSFDYQTNEAKQYEWVGGISTPSLDREVRSTPIAKATETTRFSDTFSAPSCGQSWVGLRRVGSDPAGKENEPVFVMDNLLVEDLGEAPTEAACSSLEVRADPGPVAPEQAKRVVTTLTSAEPADVTDVKVKLEVPKGWSVQAIGPDEVARLAPGKALTTTWNVTAPQGASGSFELTATATYTATTGKPGTRTLTNTATVTTMPAAPTGTQYLSDLDWPTTPKNGWGPVERDQANGEAAAGDGPAITLGGKTYAKGLGTHADASVEYFLGGNCRTFTATVGIDDAKAKPPADVVFTVKGDGKQLHTTGIVRPTLPQSTNRDIRDLNVDVTGVQRLTLEVGQAISGNGNDWADWADAKIECRPAPASLTVTPDTVAAGAEVTLKGTGFAPSEEVRISLTGRAGAIGSTTADKQGAIEAQVLIPADASLGATRIAAQSVISGHRGDTPLTITEPAKVTPSITLDPASIVQGGSLNVTGADFAAGAEVAVSLSGSQEALALGKADNAGAFSLSVTVPLNTPVGKTELLARSSDGKQQASAELTVTARPVPNPAAITLSAPSVVQGASLTVTGTGFGPAKVVSVALRGHATLGSATTDAKGSFTARVTIPASAPTGTRDIVASAPGGPEASAKLTITAKPTPKPAAITLSTSRVVQGASLTVTGTGFGPAERVSVVLRGHATLGSATTDAKGSFTARVTIPLKAPTGTRDIVASAPSGKSATAKLTITAKPAPKPAAIKLSAQRVMQGGQLVVSGTGFGPAERVSVVLRGHATLGSATTDAKGSFTARVTIPLKAPTGTRDIVASSRSGKSATAKLAITAKPTPKLSASPARVKQGGTLTLRGTGFAAGKRVSVTLSGYRGTLANAAADRSGAFSVRVTLPKSARVGTSVLTATSTVGGARASASVRIDKRIIPLNPANVQRTALYRFVHKSNGTHRYVTKAAEVRKLKANKRYRFAGRIAYVATSHGLPRGMAGLHRFEKKSTGTQVIVTSAKDVAKLKRSRAYRHMGVIGYVAQTARHEGGTLAPLYRFEHKRTGGSVLTRSATEVKKLKRSTAYRYRGVLGYAAIKPIAR